MKIVSKIHVYIEFYFFYVIPRVILYSQSEDERHLSLDMACVRRKVSNYKI